MGRRNNDYLKRALDLWQPPADAGDALVCIATSFTFDAAFFETECLGRFLQMSSNPSESEAVGYLIEREEKLSASKVCALVDRRHARDKESLRWDVLGVLNPRGIQHAKIAVLAWMNTVRLIIGSGNLTEPGYRKNLEVFGAIDTSRSLGGNLTALRSALAFLEEVVSLAVGDDSPKTPKSRVRAAINEVRNHVKEWPNIEPKIDDPLPVFGMSGKGALQQLGTLWPGGGPPRTASVISPFFDLPGNDRIAIEALIRILAKRRPRRVRFDVRSCDSPDARIRIYAPLGMIRAALESCEVEVHRVLPTQFDEIRELHAKMLLLESDEWLLLMIGSSNFTAGGLTGLNLEANLVYRVKQSTSGEKQLSEIWPQASVDPIDIGSPALIWDPESEAIEGGGEQIALPACFRDAIFIAGGEAQLLITLVPQLPKHWDVRVPHGAELLGERIGSVAGRHVFPWTNKPVPFVLEVTWSSPSGTHVANWPVNVSDVSQLPPPDALRDLTLEELLEILSSTRPLSEAVVHVLQKRSKMRAKAWELDPLKRLDSQNYLLRRTKRVAAALERLRQRLERPAVSPEAFEWRLRGPVGPMSLAEAFVRESKMPGEASFYLAELALAMKRVQPQLATTSGLPAQTIKALLAAAVDELHKRSHDLPPTPNTMLGQYVAEAFHEASLR